MFVRRMSGLHPVGSGVEPPLVLGGGHPEAAPEMAVEVALVGEAGGGGGVGDAVARFEQATGRAEAVGELQRVGGEAGAFADEADEPKLAEAGGGRQLVEPDVALGLVAEVLAGGAERRFVAGAT